MCRPILGLHHLIEYAQLPRVPPLFTMFIISMMGGGEKSLTSKKRVTITLVMHMQVLVKCIKLVTHTLLGNNRHKLETGNPFT